MKGETQFISHFDSFLPVKQYMQIGNFKSPNVRALCQDRLSRKISTQYANTERAR